VRPLRPGDDLPSLDEYERELVARAAAKPDAENRGLVWVAGGDVRGLVLFGSIGGTEGTARIRVVAGDGAGELISAAIAELAARKVVAEVSDDAHHSAMISALVANGFSETGRIADYVRDGVALVIFERP
jgi:hypothetical protein